MSKKLRSENFVFISSKIYFFDAQMDKMLDKTTGSYIISQLFTLHNTCLSFYV